MQQRTGCHILLALKGFAMFRVFPLIRRYLKGVCASSPHEARLGREEFGGEVHGHAPAYSEADLRELLTLCDHLVFNSFSQWQRFQPLISTCPAPPRFGLRVNPMHSETAVALYDPCAPGSRLGIRREQFSGKSLTGITGLHFHTLCEKGADALARTAAAFEEQFQDILPAMQWLNLGGGHHITKPDYDLDLLCEVIDHFSKKYDLTIYLEPGEAIAIHTGALITTVLDIVENDGPIAILDTSVTCHMPDVLEMPYRPDIRGAGEPGELAHTYRLGGVSCLAGDVLGTLLLCPAPAGGRPADHRRHEPLHHGQDHHLQRGAGCRPSCSMSRRRIVWKSSANSATRNTAGVCREVTCEGYRSCSLLSLPQENYCHD